MKTVIALAALAFSGASLACGLCIEDKVAAVYDHAVVSRATAANHQVAFFVLEGPLAGTEAEKQLLQSAVASVAGVDAGSARASSELQSVSFAFDPARSKLAVLERALQLKLNKRQVRLALVRVVDKGSLKIAGNAP
jgi:hypothetical protein